MTCGEKVRSERDGRRFLQESFANQHLVLETRLDLAEFWPAKDPERKVVGTLTIADGGENNLETVGTFERDLSDWSNDNPLPWTHCADGDWETMLAPHITPDGSTPERTNYREVVLVQRLTRVGLRQNPQMLVPGIEEILQRLLDLDRLIAGLDPSRTLSTSSDALLLKILTTEPTSDIRHNSTGEHSACR